MAGPDTVVFLGPTLPLDEARARLPEAGFCPPVRCGDVLALLRLAPPPARIAIIDGNFEQVAAVWHKELLFAMTAGVRVYGAASMGALRAAELAEHGMIGVGTVFADYLSGALVDDDEVALVHGPSAHGHQPLSDAMVNVRATLARAVGQGVVDSEFAERICLAAKRVFFHERVLARVVAELDDPRARRLLEWLPGGQVDVKRADAVELLAVLREDRGTPPTGAPVASAFLRGLQAYVACRPMPVSADWLPSEERLGQSSRLMGESYLLLRHLTLARVLAAAADLSGTPDDLAGARPAFAMLLRAFGLYPAYRAARDQPGQALAVGVAARLACEWRRLELGLEARGVVVAPTAAEVLGFAQRFQRERGLTTQASLDAWLAANDLTAGSAYAGFLLGWMTFSHCVNPMAGDLYGIVAIDVTRNWFLETLRDSGLARALDEPAARAALAAELRRRWALPEAARDAFARVCDFAGEAELEQALRALEG